MPGTHPHRRRQWIGPALLLLGTAGAYLWNLSANGWANPFYAAAVEAGSSSWKAFFFGALDTGNVITIDKTPAALWPMALSARIFGMSTWSMLIPQVLLGVGSVALLWATVRRHFGSTAGLLAGALLAVTPVAALMFRFDNPDAALVFLMLAAVWAMSCALSEGRWRWLVLCGLFVGVGFLAKQLQVLLVLPALALTYLIAGPPALGKRIAQLLAAGAAMVVGAGWWLLIAVLWPTDRRPYFGGSQHNSIIELTLGYNGLDRLDGGGTGLPGGPGHSPGPPGGAHGGSGPFADTGLGRLFSSQVGAQISWFIPAALILGVAALARYGRAPRTDRRRAVLFMFGAWAVVTGVVFSFMGGIFHEYYTVALAPALAGTVAAAVATLIPHRDRWWVRLVFVAAVVATAITAWAVLSRTPDFLPWLRWTIAGGAVLTAVVLLSARLRGRAAVIALIAALCTGLAGPAAYAAQTVHIPHTGNMPLAGPKVDRGMPGPRPSGDAGAPAAPGGGHMPRPGSSMSVDAAVVELLDHDAGSYTWTAATVGAMQQASYQLATAGQIMAVGGYTGGDPAPTLEQFRRYVADGAIHYYIGGGFNGRQGLSDDTEGAKIDDWVKQNFAGPRMGDLTLYDLTAVT